MNKEKTPTTSGDEELVEQLFQYYDDIDCAETVNQRINAQEQAELWLKRLLTTKNQQITAAKAEERAETIKAAVSAIEGERKPVPLIEDDEEAYHACRDFNNGLTAAITAVEEVGKNESV